MSLNPISSESDEIGFQTQMFKMASRARITILRHESSRIVARFVKCCVCAYACRCVFEQVVCSTASLVFLNIVRLDAKAKYHFYIMMVWARGHDRLRHVSRAAGLYETKTMIAIAKLALCQTCDMCKDACILCLPAPRGPRLL